MRNIAWGIILIAMGILFLLDNMNIMDFGYALRTYWPALLILWGIAILLKKKDSERTRVFGDTTDTVTDEIIHESSVFGNLHVRITSQHFKGGSVSTVFGNASIDLSNGVVAGGEHVLRINGVFGDARMTMPKEVAVSVSGSVLFGDVKVFDMKKSGFSPDILYMSPGYESAPKRLKVVMTQVFGNITVV